MSVSTRTRFEILKRDGFRCRYCGASAIEVMLHVDHVIPSSKGGTDDPENLITACADCNLGKSDVRLDESRIVRGPSSADAEEHAAQIRSYLEAQRDVQAAKREVYEYIADYWLAVVGQAPLQSWFNQLGAITQKHPLSRIIESIDVVAGSGITSQTSRVKYFYGALRRRAERENA